MVRRVRRAATARCTSPRSTPPTVADLSGKQKVANASSLRTLYKASELTGLDPAALRTDTTANINGGAALLASYQRSLGLPVGADTSPAEWYGAVASYAEAGDRVAASGFADDVYSIMARGAARTTNTGQQVVMPAVAVTPDKAQVNKLALPAGMQPATSGVECPPSLGCEWLPAPYSEFGTAGTTATMTSRTGRRPARSTTSSSTTPRAPGRVC